MLTSHVILQQYHPQIVSWNTVICFSRSTKHISTISQKLAKGQRSGTWWICQDKIRIVHPEIEVLPFHGISFRGTLHRLFLENLIKKCSAVNAFLLVSFFVNRNQHIGLPLLRYFTSFPSYLAYTNQPTNPKVVYGL